MIRRQCIKNRDAEPMEFLARLRGPLLEEFEHLFLGRHVLHDRQR